MPDLHPAIAFPEPRLGLFWVYILQSADGTCYVGQPRDLRERLRKFSWSRDQLAGGQPGIPKNC